MLLFLFLIFCYLFTKKICILLIPAEACDLKASCFFKLKCPERQQTALHRIVCHLKNQIFKLKSQLQNPSKSNVTWATCQPTPLVTFSSSEGSS